MKETVYGRKINILIIDNDPLTREKIARSLNHSAYNISSCGSIAEALYYLNSEHYDCIIMDVDLPEMKGYRAIPLIHSLHPDIRIIMTSNKNSKELEAKIREQNIFYYYIKSFDISELQQAVRFLFDNKQI